MTEKMFIARSRSRGMTLLEVLLAALLLSLVAGGIGGVVWFTQTHLLRALLLNQAVGFSTGQMEQLVAKPYDDSALATGTTTDVVLPAASLLVSRFSGAASYTVTEQKWGTSSPDDYKQINLTVTWNDGTSRTLTVSAVKRKPLPPP